MGNIKFEKNVSYEKMAAKTSTATLPVLFCNEAKHEDCLTIMDEYAKTLSDNFTAVHGTYIEYKMV